MARVIRSFVFFGCVFAVHFLSEQQVLCNQGLTRNLQLGVAHANFVEHLFHYLNVSQVGSGLVNQLRDCAAGCLRVVSCFSFNLAAYPDIDGRMFCEFLASDKYNWSDKFEESQDFHHYSIGNPCSGSPCANNGTCIALYHHYDFKCTCPQGFMGKKCEMAPKPCIPNPCKNDGTCKDLGENKFECTCKPGFEGADCSKIQYLSDSEILRGHPDYAVKLKEYLAPVLASSKQWKLCFRASTHQYSGSAFHAACDTKGPTVTFVQVGNYVFGGYTDKSWNGKITGYIHSTAAFLFSLKNHVNQQYKMLTYRYQQHAIYNRQSYGPTFGGGHDLDIKDKCNANTNSYTRLGRTYRAPNGYAYGSSQAMNLLAGSRYFKCDEYEVFYQV